MRNRAPARKREKSRLRFLSGFSRRSKAASQKTITAKKPARRSSDNYHLATIALVAIVIFLAASIFVQFKARSTGFVIADSFDNSWVVQTFVTDVQDCNPIDDNYNPYTAGYVTHSGNIISSDTCIDSSRLLEYSCDSSGRLKSDMIVCDSGCVKEGIYGRCG